MYHRLRVEYWLRRRVRKEDCVLCLGNLPPLLLLPGRVVVFLQNRYLVEKVSLAEFKLKSGMRILLERLWLAVRISHAQSVVVQTPSMRRLVRRRWRIPVSVSPFVDKTEGYHRQASLAEGQVTTTFDFLYVADGQPHKNHRNLIRAWVLLAKEGIRPLLALTLVPNKEKELWRWIDSRRHRYRLRVVAVGHRPYVQMSSLYRSARALIYPSTLETIGLPLIEARQAGLPVLAPELDYVRDVIDPEEVFDPGSALSIARAVKRFSGISESPLPVCRPEDFLTELTVG